jgi:hypothetical protein
MDMDMDMHMDMHMDMDLHMDMDMHMDSERLVERIHEFSLQEPSGRQNEKGNYKTSEYTGPSFHF